MVEKYKYYKQKKYMTMKTKLFYILMIFIISFSSFVIGKPTPNPQNQYYIFGDNTNAVPMIGFNWSNNETYLYPFNESLFYMNETGFAYDLANVSVDGVGDGYAGDMGHPHNQDLNTTDNVTFDIVTANAYYGDGGNLTNITAVGDGYAGDIGHPHDQDLNTTNNVTFSNISLPYQPACRVRLSGAGQSIPPNVLIKLNLNTVDYDQNNDYLTGINPAFIVPYEGLYHICYSVCVCNMPDRTYLYSLIRVNNIDTGVLEISHSSTITVTDLSNSGSDILNLSAYDRVELWVMHNNPAPFSLFPALAWTNYMAICKVA